MRVTGDWRVPVLLLGGAVYLCANLFSSHLVPFLIGGDQVYFWTAAQRMLRGEHIYRDFLQSLPPGVDLVYAAAFAATGSRVWVTNAVVLALGVVLTGFCYVLATRIMDRSRAFLAAWLFLVLVYSKLLNATHHWFSTLAVLGAAAVLMKEITTRRLIIAGVLLGLASFCTQTRGVIGGLGIVVYLVWEARGANGGYGMRVLRNVALLGIAAAVALVVLNVYFVSTSGLGRIWYYQVIYVLHDVLGSHKTTQFGLPYVVNLHNLPALLPYLAVYLLPTMAYVLVLAGRWRRATGRPDPVLLLTLVGSALLFEVALSISWLRVYCVVLPGIILFVWMLGMGRPVGYLVTGLWLAIGTLAVEQVWVRQRSLHHLIQLPAGPVMVADDAAEKLAWLVQHTRPGDAFFQAPWPGLYVPLELHNPLFVDVFEPNKMTRTEWVRQSVAELQLHPVRYILWEPKLDPPAGTTPPDDYNLGDFVTFLHSRYRPVKTFADRAQIWEVTLRAEAR